MLAERPALHATATDDPRWAAVRARDAAADGSFFYSVATTGVYCRPSCAARTPRRENVAFHRTAADAERAGFRPCKRCRPDRSPGAAQADRIAELCRYIEACEQPPSLAALAERAGLSPSHLQRVFKATTGVTPSAYARGQRGLRVRRQLAAGNSVTEAIYGAGFGSSGRFYESADAVLGMTPRAYREGGAGAEIRFALGQCSLGAILVAQSARGVCAIALGDDPEALAQELQDRFPRARLIGDDPAFAALVAQVVGFVEAPRRGLELPLDVRGTAFQLRVWEALRAIPPGRTVSYAELAAILGEPGSARAVARACASNVIAVAIPCHRVIRRDGGTSGYRWGVARKVELLARERS